MVDSYIPDVSGMPGEDGQVGVLALDEGLHLLEHAVVQTDTVDQDLLLKQDQYCGYIDCYHATMRCM